MTWTYDYPRPALTVDCVVFGVDETDLKVLLVRRGLPPYENRWALPGGFVRLDETLDEAAARELQEEAGLRRIYLEQLYTFGDVERDPRERVVTVAYFALVRMSDHQARAATDARDARWASVRQARNLAFDHARILKLGRQRLKSKVRYQPLGFELLPEKFTLGQLQNLYQIVLERELDKRNFRRKVLSTGVLQELDEWEQGVPRRPAQLYRFDRLKYRRLSEQGFLFEL